MVRPSDDLSPALERIAVGGPEVAFQMVKILVPWLAEYSLDEVMDAVDTVHLSIELPDPRLQNYAKVGGAHLITDNACAHEVITGPPFCINWRLLDFSKHMVTSLQ
jgi:2-keto-4-pentenoate hydratase